MGLKSVFFGIIVGLFAIVMVGPNNLMYFTSVYNTGGVAVNVPEVKVAMPEIKIPDLVDNDFIKAGVIPSGFKLFTSTSDFFDKLASNQSIDTFFVIGKDYSETDLSQFIEHSFPKAKIENIVATDLATTNISKNDFLLAVADFKSKATGNIASFHDQLATSTIEAFDYTGLTAVETNYFDILFPFLNYAEKMNVQNVEFIDSGYVIFKYGENRYENSFRPFSILAVGDIMLGRDVRNKMDKLNNHFYPFEKISGDNNSFFKGMDLVFGNLEGPIYKDGYKSDVSLTFGFPEYVTPVLRDIGFDVLSLANNHTTNQRQEGLDSTYKQLENVGIGACGHPNEEKTDTVVYRQLGATLVGFVCFDDISGAINDANAIEVVKNTNKEADFTVVSMHAGVEYKHTPNKRQISLAHSFVDAGADLIIGHHPHVVQPFEVYNGVPILYSLGNFVFDQDWSFDTKEELAYGIVVSEDNYKLYLFPIMSIRSQPALMDEKASQAFYDRFISWGNSFIGYDDDLQREIRSGVVEFAR